LSVVIKSLTVPSFCFIDVRTVIVNHRIARIEVYDFVIVVQGSFVILSQFIDEPTEDVSISIVGIVSDGFLKIFDSLRVITSIIVVLPTLVLLH
jgi:hypothetical protein